MVLNPTKVIIADTQYLTINAFTHLIEEHDKLELHAQMSDIIELGTSLSEMGSGILIIDPKQLGFESISKLNTFLKPYEQIKTVVTVNNLQLFEVNELLRLNFKNVVYKTSEEEDIYASLEAAIRGRKFFCEAFMEQIYVLNNGSASQQNNNVLTASETDIVKLIAQGLTTKEIAAQKSLSFHTINTHRKNIFRKLGVMNTSELIIYAIKAGLIDNIEYTI